jgi:hypothetical protein
MTGFTHTESRRYAPRSSAVHKAVQDRGTFLQCGVRLSASGSLRLLAVTCRPGKYDRVR